MITVRKFEADDAPALAELMIEMLAFYDSPLAVKGPIPEDIVRQSRSVEIAVALHEGRPGGFTTFGFLYPVAGLQSFAYLQQIYVGTEFRRLGLARELMAFIARACRERGCQWMEWSTGRDNVAARRFYEGLGAKGYEKMAYHLSGSDLAALAGRA